MEHLVSCCFQLNAVTPYFRALQRPYLHSLTDCYERVHTLAWIDVDSNENTPRYSCRLEDAADGFAVAELDMEIPLLDVEMVVVGVAEELKEKNLTLNSTQERNNKWIGIFTVGVFGTLYTFLDSGTLWRSLRLGMKALGMI